MTMRSPVELEESLLYDFRSFPTKELRKHVVRPSWADLFLMILLFILPEQDRTFPPCSGPVYK